MWKEFLEIMVLLLVALLREKVILEMPILSKWWTVSDFYFLLYTFFCFFWRHHSSAWGILAPRPGTEP